MRLIDADALIPKLKCICEGENQIYRRESWGFAIQCLNAVEDAPTINPQPHWIPCSERLPEEDVYVLISKKPSPISGNKFSVTIGMRYINRRSKKAEWRDSGFGFLSDDKVLAWMPLPSPYQPKEDES